MAASALQSQSPRAMRRRRRPRWVWVLIGLLAVVVVLALYFLNSVRLLRPAVNSLRVDSATLEGQLRAGDLSAAAATMGLVRMEVGQVDSATGGPVWAAAAYLPVVGGDVDAVRTIVRVGDEVTSAARPLESALPALSPAKIQAAGGAIDTGAVRQIATAMPTLGAAVTKGSTDLDAIDVSRLPGSIADGVTKIRDLLDSAKGPLTTAQSFLPTLPTLLGADGKRTYFVMLQQDAEARGTGGLMAAYAIISLDKGKVTLVETKQNGTLRNIAIPSATAVPQEIQDLWGSDLNEWAGLNLSPNFPWTGQLVAAGWAARPDVPPLDGVLAIDGHVVQAILAGTGTIAAGGVKLTKDDAAKVLAKDIYLQHPNDNQVDAITGQLVDQLFGKVSQGRLNLPALVSAMEKPYAERRVLMWSSHPDEQNVIATMSLGGALPSAQGPFAMTVVNNGGGNKLDAYLDVASHYEPGACTSGVRIGSVTVDLTNTAPASGLPPIVDPRTDLKELGLPNPTRGSNRLLVDIYTSVGSETPAATLDGANVPIIVSGADQGHTVSRVEVPINPGQKRTLMVTVVDLPSPDSVKPVTLVQPMVNPATMTVGDFPACS